MPDEDPLTDEQRLVLQAIYDSFRAHGDWPTFISIDRPLRRDHRIDTAVIVQSVPGPLIINPHPGGLRPSASDKLRLKLQGIAACDGGLEDTDRFVRTLRWLAQREVEFEPGLDTSAVGPRVTSEEIRDHLRLAGQDDVALSRLYTMFQTDNWGLAGGGQTEDGWYVNVTPDIWRFRDAHTVRYCVAAQKAWDSEGMDFDILLRDDPVWGKRAHISSQIHAESSAQPAAARSYIHEQIIAAIKGKASTITFNCTKLLSLIEELNDNYGHGNTYASHAVLRAIIDHIPPILGCPDFQAVANNYAWGRTDKQYMKRLQEFRNQADDALHRQISSKADLLDFDDMPSSVYVDRLLQECADKL